MIIQKMDAQVRSITELSPTAREVHIELPKPLNFLPGSFVNVFLTKNGVRMRRAYSLSSPHTDQQHIALTIRKGSPEGMSSVFFEEGIEGTHLEIMGPLGLNTVEKIKTENVFLFGFGIGAGVIKGMLHGLLEQKNVRSITVVTGSRTEDEILYKNFFISTEHRDPRVHVRFVVSRPASNTYPLKGYVQDHIAHEDFSSSTVYICGTGTMCTALEHAITTVAPVAPTFLIEAFD